MLKQRLGETFERLASELQSSVQTCRELVSSDRMPAFYPSIDSLERLHAEFITAYDEYRKHIEDHQCRRG